MPIYVRSCLIYGKWRLYALFSDASAVLVTLPIDVLPYRGGGNPITGSVGFRKNFLVLDPPQPLNGQLRQAQAQAQGQGKRLKKYNMSGRTEGLIGDGKSKGSAHSREAVDMNVFTVFANSKAGMEEVDKEKINQVIYDMSKNSNHFKNEQRKNALVDKKIEEMRKRLAVLEASRIDHSASWTRVCKMMADMETTRDLTRTWIVIDMDMFFAAVEIRDNPSLRGKPVAVGGMSMISTSNYEARKFGVRSAMPGFIARKLCPDLTFVKANYRKYEAVGKQIREIFAEYDPNFTTMSLDEASLDVTDYLAKVNKCQQHGLAELEDPKQLSGGLIGRVQGEDIAREIRKKIFEATQLTASAGIAPNRMLAKICSDMHKPNGQFCLAPNRQAVLGILETLSVRKVPGIGKVTQKMLKEIGIQVCGDIHDRKKMRFLFELFSEQTARSLIERSLGIAESTRDPSEKYERKSISTERTFPDISQSSDLHQKCRDISQALAEDVERHGVEGKTITLKLKHYTFNIISRAKTLSRHIRTASDISKYALQLLKEEEARFASSSKSALFVTTNRELTRESSPSQSRTMKIRLMGVRLSNLRNTSTSKKSSLLCSTSSFPPTKLNISWPPSMLQPSPSDEPPSTTPCAYMEHEVTDPHSSLILEDSGGSLSSPSFFPGSASRSPLSISEPWPVSETIDPPVTEKTVAQKAQERSTMSAHCPICGNIISLVDNREFNRHIDLCLNANIVPKKKKQQHLKRKHDTIKTKALTDFFNKKSMKKPKTEKETKSIGDGDLKEFFCLK